MVTYTSVGFGLALSALIVCLTNLIFTLMDGHTSKPQNRVYICILFLLGTNAVCEIVNVMTKTALQSSDTVFFISRAAKYVYFLSHSLLAPVFFLYFSYAVGRSVGNAFWMRHIGIASNFVRRILPLALVVVTELIIALNPLHKFCWYYDAERNFHRAWGEYVFVYGYASVWIFLSFVLAMKSWTILSKNRKRSIALCFLMVVAGIVAQMVSSVLRIEILMEALGFTGVLLFIENEDDRKNVELDVYNSAAFSLDLSASIKNRIPVRVLILRGIQFDKTANTVMYGKLHRDSINLAVSNYLGTVVKRYYIYAISHGRFAITLYNSTEEELRQLAERITARFSEPWHIDGADIFLTSRIMLVHVPNRAKTVEDINYIAECPIPEQIHDRIIEDNALDWLIRRAAVEDAVTHGLERGSFEVYYQPTYNIDRTLHGAEALLRMHDSKLGMVYPDEFIPIAEQLSLIDTLDEFVLREVCKFILTGIPQENGMECINVNLSVLECMKEGFAEHISGIVECEGAHKKFINFEITESVASNDYDHLASVINQLKHEGFLFSIDDYGTGYSNMTALFSLGADIIKIDKSILWNAEQSELGMTLLRTSIEMIHKMGKKSLMEGVETENQIRILEQLGCNYLQGYYFSKPIPKENFISLLQSTKAGQPS